MVKIYLSIRKKDYILILFFGRFKFVCGCGIALTFGVVFFLTPLPFVVVYGFAPQKIPPRSII